MVALILAVILRKFTQEHPCKDILDMINLAQIAFGLMLISGLLVYIAFFKDSRRHRPNKDKH